MNQTRFVLGENGCKISYTSFTVNYCDLDYFVLRLSLLPNPAGFLNLRWNGEAQSFTTWGAGWQPALAHCLRDAVGILDGLACSLRGMWRCGEQPTGLRTRQAGKGKDSAEKKGYLWQRGAAGWWNGGGLQTLTVDLVKKSLSISPHQGHLPSWC